MTSHVLIGALAMLLIAGDPFSFLAPAIRLSAADRRALERGAVVSRTLDAGSGQVAVFAMSRIDVPPQSLIDHARNIEDLKRSSFVTAIHRFSDPPRLEDLDALVLSPRDLRAAAECRPGSCSFKLTAAEIGLLRAAAASAASGKDEVVQRAFREVVLSRVRAYLAGGLAGLPAIANRSTPACLARVFDEVLRASPPLPDAPCANDWLRDPTSVADRVESFLYWSQETYGGSKPVVTVTHVGLIAPASPGEPAIVLGKQVLATRYMTGGVALTAVISDRTSGASYLIYLNRSGVDLLGGFWGPLRRAVLESRLAGELPAIIGKLRTRLERAGTTR